MACGHSDNVVAFIGEGKLGRVVIAEEGRPASEKGGMLCMERDGQD